MPEPLHVIDGERESTRLRFGRGEIERALRALELVDGADYDLAMRVLFLEEQLRDAHGLARRWKENYEAMRRIAAAKNGEELTKHLDEGARKWAVEW